MKNYQAIQFIPTGLKVNNSVEGETIEAKVRRVVNNKEPITDSAEIIYTERKDGVKPEHDIRTDRWDVAVDAMDKVTKSHLAKREARHKPKDTQTGTTETGKAAQEGMKAEGNQQS